MWQPCYDGRERLVAMLCGDPPGKCREFGAGVGTPRIVTYGTRAPCAGPALDGGRIGCRCSSIARMLRSRHATIPEGVGRDGYERQKIGRRAVVSSLGAGLATWPLVSSPLMMAAEWARAWRLSRTPHLTLWHARPQRGPLCRPPPPCNRFSWATVSPGKVPPRTCRAYYPHDRWRALLGCDHMLLPATAIHRSWTCTSRQRPT